MEREPSRKEQGRLASQARAPLARVVPVGDRGPSLLPEACVSRPWADTAAQPSRPRVPSDEEPVVPPAGPRGQWFTPPPRAPLRRGPTETVAGPGDSGLSPALPALQAGRHLVAALRFRSGKCESG